MCRLGVAVQDVYQLSKFRTCRISTLTAIASPVRLFSDWSEAGRERRGHFF